MARICASSLATSWLRASPRIETLSGTTLTALGRSNAIAVIAVSDAGSLFDPGPCVYMEKIAVGPDAAEAIDIAKSATENVHNIAEALNRAPRDLTAVVLDRDRHRDLISELREVGCRIRLIPDGDVAGAISTAEPESGADVLFGIGGTPEGVIAAVALKCMDGNLQGKLWPRNDREREAAIAAGYDLDRVYGIHDLAGGENAFFAATGITDGDILQGVRFTRRGATTQSLVMRSKSGTVRHVHADHRLEKLNEYAQFDY